MPLPFLGALGGALSSIAKPLIGGALSLFGGAKSDAANKDLQMKFAKNAIQWKVEDAKKAGIHPLYALGAPTMSPSVSVGQTGAALADMGQDISRAVAVGGNEVDRKIQALSLERAGLENELLRTQINRAQMPPPSPIGSKSIIAGQSQTPAIAVGGQVFNTDPGTSDAQVIQNRYGEPAEWLAAPVIAWQDLKKHLAGKSVFEIMKMIDDRTKVFGPSR